MMRSALLHDLMQNEQAQGVNINTTHSKGKVMQQNGNKAYCTTKYDTPLKKSSAEQPLCRMNSIRAKKVSNSHSLSPKFSIHIAQSRYC
jgi:hypothetical protein